MRPGSGRCGTGTSSAWRTLVVAGAVAGAVAGVVAAGLLAGADEAWAGKRPRGSKYVQMKLVKVGQFRGNHVVLLENPAGTRLLPIWIGAREAAAIHLGLKGVRPSRPQTHNLLVAVLGKLKAKIHRVMVVALKNKVFIGRLELTDARGKLHRIDARPSDLCALAAVKGLRVLVSRAVLKAAGVQAPKPKRPAPRPTSI